MASGMHTNQHLMIPGSPMTLLKLVTLLVSMLKLVSSGPITSGSVGSLDPSGWDGRESLIWRMAISQKIGRSRNEGICPVGRLRRSGTL